MPYTTLLLRSASALATLLLLMVPQAGGARTNVVLIVVDDLGWKDLACYGHAEHRTPHIDQLSREGTRLTHGYAACAVCSPTRAAVMTGRYPARLGVTDFIHFLAAERSEHERLRRHPQAYSPGPRGMLWCPPNHFWLDREELTIAELLRGAGYVTCHVGKWHLGNTDWYPDQQGFDLNLGGCDLGQPPSYFDPYHRNRRFDSIPTLPPRRDREYLTDRLADEACRFVRETSGRPFFLHFAPYSVHTPIQGRPDLVAQYRGRLPPDTTSQRLHYAAMVSAVDEAVGKLMQTLQTLELRERTLVIFTSDNGGLSRVTSNAPLRGGKGTPYEGGIRVPWIFRMPGGVPAGRISEVPVSSVDILPTVCDFTDVGLPQDRAIDGVSLRQLLQGEVAAAEELAGRPLYWHFPHFRQRTIVPYSVVRAGPWKLIRRYTDAPSELFQLLDDPQERRDQATERPDRVVRLEQLLADWLVATGAKLPRKTAE